MPLKSSQKLALIKKCRKMGYGGPMIDIINAAETHMANGGKLIKTDPDPTISGGATQDRKKHVGLMQQDLAQYNANTVGAFSPSPTLLADGGDLDKDKIITWKNDKDYIQGISDWGIASDVPITNRQNEDIKRKLRTGNYGYNPRTGALIILPEEQRGTISAADRPYVEETIAASRRTAEEQAALTKAKSDKALAAQRAAKPNVITLDQFTPSYGKPGETVRLSNEELADYYKEWNKRSYDDISKGFIWNAPGMIATSGAGALGTAGALSGLGAGASQIYQDPENPLGYVTVGLSTLPAFRGVKPHITYSTVVRSAPETQKGLQFTAGKYPAVMRGGSKTVRGPSGKSSFIIKIPEKDPFNPVLTPEQNLHQSAFLTDIGIDPEMTLQYMTGPQALQKGAPLKLMVERMKVADLNKLKGKNLPSEVKKMSYGPGEYGTWDRAAKAGEITEEQARRFNTLTATPEDIAMARANPKLWEPSELVVDQLTAFKLRQNPTFTGTPEEAVDFYKELVKRENSPFSQFRKNIHKGLIDKAYGGPLNQYQTPIGIYAYGGPMEREGLEKRILKKYPAFTNVFGEEGENLHIVKDKNFDPKAHSDEYGDIEFMFPNVTEIPYTKDYTYQSPFPGDYVVAYNPKSDVTKGDIFLDMLHGMRGDNKYNELLKEFKDATLKHRGEDILWEWDDVKNNPDIQLALESQNNTAFQQFEDNYVDGMLRSHLANMGMGKKSKDPGYEIERKFNSKEMEKVAKKIYDYLKTNES